MKKRFLAMLLVLAMLFGMLPTSVIASETEAPVTEDTTASVYFSASHDADYLVGEQTGEVLAMKKIDVPYFDLANYDLTDFYFMSESYGDGDGDGAPGGNEFENVEPYEGKVTMLHLLIYATEVFQYGVAPEEAGQGYLKNEGLLGTEVLSVGGSAGSMVINYFWGFDMNLNYYVNYEYPLASEGWGATLDQILLEDGDMISIGHFTGWSFYSDSTSIFNYIKAGEDIVTTTANRGDQVTLSAYHAGSDFSGSGATAHTAITYQPDIYYTSVDNVASGEVAAWEYLATVDANGEFTIDTTDMEPGEYLISMAGQYGQEYSDEICSAPGGIRLTVEAAENPVPETYPVTFTGHTAQLNSFKLYTYENGVKGETDLLADVADSDTSNTQLYATELPSGDYWLEGYDANGDCNGSIVITVEAKELNEFKVYRAYQIYASNSGWVLGTDYELSAEVTNTDKTVNRQAVMGSGDVYGTVYPSCLCLHGDTVKITYTPIGDKADTCIETFKTATMTINSSSWSQKIPETVEVTFVAPADSVISAGKFHTYYVYDFSEPMEIGEYHDLTEDTSDDETDDRIYYKFKMPKETVNAINGPNFFYRVQNEQGVTYWDFFAPAALTETTIEITAEELFIGSEEFNSETVYHNFEKNTYDRADIYLNANGQGYMNLDVGESFELNVFRNWMAIENFYNRKVALPDMQYTVIDENGNPSDLLTIIPDANNSSVAKMTANGEGTAIVLVTYDAMFSTASYVSETPNQPNQYSAIWPENTAVLVVSVGADGTAIETNMVMNRYGSTGNLDAEHDTLFYVGKEGAEYTFTPEAGCTVTVNRSVVTDTMTFDGFTSEGVVVDETGAVTVSGLTTGRHIIKVEKDGLAAYQVITAREVSYEFQDADGNPLAADTEVKAGDTIYIQFTGLINPCEKLSGVYNHNARIYYVGEDDTEFASSSGGAFGVYDFSGNPERQRIAITIPKYWPELEYTLNGAIKMNLSGSAPGAHRGTTYAKGLNANFNAGTGIGSVLSALPEITIDLAETNFLTGTLSFQNQDGAFIDSADLTITMTDADGNSVIVAEDGTFKCVPEEYNYIINGTGIQYTTGSASVAEDSENTFVITLQTSSEGAWDGMSETEPAQDENGVYQITTGAELAWFVKISQAGTSVSGKLMNDIDLAWYPWTYTGSNTNNATILDGNYKEIINLNTSKGLFATLGNGSHISNLTVRGEMNPASASSGALVGYAYGTTTVVEDCVSYVDITSTNATIGGLVGYTNGTIKDCENYGTITSTGNCIGGILGSAMANAQVINCYNAGAITGGNFTGGIVGYDGNYKLTLTGCYNTGAVNGTNYVGGVIGYLMGGTYAYQGGASAMAGCYNTGAVTGSEYVGGVIGRVGTASVADCYNIGTVTGTSNAGGFVGQVYDTNVTAERIYYLEGTTDSDTGAVALGEDELKKAELNPELFGGVCDGYPALLWQMDVTFHVKPEEGTVIAPKCEEKGYTEYICTECGEGFNSNYVDALGHAWCEDADSAQCEDCVYSAPTCVEEGSIVRTCVHDGCDEPKTEVIPATGHTEDESQTVVSDLYKDCVCSVCGESYRVWNEERLQYVDLLGDGITDASVTDEGDYPWIYNEETQRFESTNVDKNSTTSKTSFTVTLANAGNISFNYGVSSENNWDKMTITAASGDTTIATIADAISGTQENSFTYELPAGTYTLTFSYTKDGSSKSGSDLGWFSDLKVECELPVELDVVFEKDWYAEGETVTANVYVKGNTAFNSAGYSLTYNPETMAYVTGTVEDDFTLLRTNVDENAGNVLRAVYILPPAAPQADEEGRVLLDTITFIALQDTDCEFGFTTVADDVDFEDRSVIVLVDGEYLNVTPKITYLRLVEEELPYTDVAEADWYYDAVYYNYFAGLMFGVTETTFEPATVLTRAQLASILYRMEGAPEVAYEGTFEDVEEGVWYTDAVAWAVESGVITGYADGTFGPHDVANREQMAVILYRYAALKGYDTTATVDLSAFEDGTSVSVYAEEAMKWAVGSGIILGKGTGTELAPQSQILRCECAVMIYRFAN